MNGINILFKKSSITLPLHFKNYKKADEIRKEISQAKKEYEARNNLAILSDAKSNIVIEDDYGSIAELDLEEISGVILVDLHREFDRQGEVGIIQAKAQKRSQDNFRADPANKIIQPANQIIPAQ